MSLTKATSNVLTFPLSASLGSASAPSYSFSGDPDTGIFSSGADTLSFATSGTNRLTIMPDGSVGIGVSNPSTMLQITQNGSNPAIKVSGGVNPAIQVANGTVVIKQQCNDGTNTGVLGTQTAHGLRLITNNSDRLSIDSTGNVGIGTTNPSSILNTYSGRNDFVRIQSSETLHNVSKGISIGNTISGTSMRDIGKIGVIDASVGSTNYAFYIQNAYDGDIRFQTNGANDRLILNSTRAYFSGNVGIGTTSPSAKVHSQSNTEQLRLGYDSTNYISATVGSTGGVTFSNAGTATDVWIYNGNAVFNGTANRMPNQTAATGDSVMTSILDRESDAWCINTVINLLPYAHTQGGGVSSTAGNVTRSFIGAGLSGSSCGPSYWSPLGGDPNAGGQTAAGQKLALAIAYIGLKHSNADIVWGVGLPDTLPAFGNPYLTNTGIGVAITSAGAILFTHNGTTYTQTSPLNTIQFSSGRIIPLIISSNGLGRVRLFSTTSAQFGTEADKTPLLEISDGGPITGNYGNNGTIRNKIVSSNATTTTIITAAFAVKTILNPTFA